MEVTNTKEGSPVWTMWRVRKTAFQMCCDRGYLVTDEQLEETLEEFISQFPDGCIHSNQLTLLFEHQLDFTNRIYVFFPFDSVTQSFMTSCCKMMDQDEVQNAIIVHRQKSLPPAMQSYIKEQAPRLLFVVFVEQELLTNITEHRLVPRHIVLTKEQKLEVLLKYGIQDHQLPQLLASDPIARYYGMRTGQVVKIVRPSETAGRCITYRVVV